MLASNFKLPLKNIVISLGPTTAKQEFLSTGAAKQLQVGSDSVTCHRDLIAGCLGERFINVWRMVIIKDCNHHKMKMCVVHS